MIYGKFRFGYSISGMKLFGQILERLENRGYTMLVPWHGCEKCNWIEAVSGLDISDSGMISLCVTLNMGIHEKPLIGLYTLSNNYLFKIIWDSYCTKHLTGDKGKRMRCVYSKNDINFAIDEMLSAIINFDKVYNFIQSDYLEYKKKISDLEERSKAGIAIPGGYGRKVAEILDHFRYKVNLISWENVIGEKNISDICAT